MARKLSVKQQRFIDAYSGNGTQAARVAGYKGNDKTLAEVARENLAKPGIAQAISERERQRMSGHIMTREERQQFWSSVTRDVSVDMSARLRASELLGRSEADFVDRVEHSGKLSLEQLVAASETPA